MVVGLLVLELGHERVALDVGGAVKHAAHVPQVHDVHGSVVRRQRVRVYLGVRPLCGNKAGTNDVGTIYCTVFITLPSYVFSLRAMHCLVGNFL